jgi:hypothetical protein
VVVHTYNPRLRRLRQEDCQFQDSLGYIVSSRSAWYTGEPSLKKQQKERKKGKKEERKKRKKGRKKGRK